ncbi:unnamed protein product [Lactuca virosa]|uniref:Uncharacterized protein n=1 Tax=Lactuca virosa TaxID=75947 RepID=A0AAU9PTV1_9ASTR|nr:unnamed protein product [Lactuca virosa]
MLRAHTLPPSHAITSSDAGNRNSNVKLHLLKHCRCLKLGFLRGLEIGASDDSYDDPFAGIYEPFSGLTEMDFELHGIYMDHEPWQEFVSKIDKSPVVNVVPLVNEVIREDAIEVSVKVSQEPVLMVNEVIEVEALDPIVNEVPWVNEADDIMVLEEEEVDVTVKVAQDLKESLDEVGDEINQILGYRNASDASDVPFVNDGGAELEFTEEHA